MADTQGHVATLQKVAAAWQLAMNVAGEGPEVLVAVCDAEGKVAADTKFGNSAQAAHFVNSLRELGFVPMSDRSEKARRGYDRLLVNESFQRA